MRPKVLGLTAALAAQLCVSGVALAQDATNPNAVPPAATPPEGQGNAASSAVGGPSTAEAAPSPNRRAGQEEIVVTGSRVRRKDLTTPAPVTVISREQIQSSSTTNIGDFLQQLPEQGGALNSNVNNGGDGETQISLRQLGAQRTLVLVDGKRFVPGGAGAGAAVDLNTIPTGAVERVEVLKDGASAVYGSDAIGGVVNIITRKRFDGVQLSAYGGMSQHNDAKTETVDLLAGTKSDKGSFMFGAGYFNQESMFAGNRSWANKALSYDFTNGTVGSSGSGTLEKVRVNALDPTKCPTTLCQELAAIFGKGKKNFIYDPGTTLPNAEGWRRRVSSTDFFNYQAVNYLVTPSQRVQLFGNGEYKLNDSARAYVQASYVNRQSKTQVAPEPFVTTAAGVAVTADNYYNPFGIDIVSAQRRLIELSGRATSYDLDTFRVVTGIDGTLPDTFGPLHGWFYDASFNYGRTSGVNSVTGFLDTTKTGPGLGPSFKDPTTGQITCGTPANPIPNCTPVNLFAPAGGLTPDMVTQLGAYTGPSNGFSQLASIQANVGGDLFSITADRPVALAIGFEHRNEYGGFVPNPIVSAGYDSDTGSPGPGTTVGSFYLNEGYAELTVPLLSKVPGVEVLELDGAVRVSNYNTFGTDATYKAGARYSPIRDVTFRGTYSTGFRAPAIAELYSAAGAGNYESATDPCAQTTDPALIKACGAAANNGITVAQINSITGGNPKLQPEKAETGTIGAVFQPGSLRNFTMTVDYYLVSLTQTIGSYGTQLILNKCYGAGTAQDTSFCNLIQRDPTTQGANLVTDINANVGGVRTSGIDLAATYAQPTDFGRFVLQFNGSYLLKYDTILPDGTTIKSAGNYDGPGAVSASGNLFPRVKFNAGLSYGLEGFSAVLFGRFIGPFIECAPDGGLVAGANTGPGFCYQKSGTNGTPFDPTTGGTQYPVHKVPSQMTFDLLLSYRMALAGGSTRFSVGVRNLLDTNPPRVYDSFLTYADPQYDFIGRYFYGRIEHTF